MRRRRRKERSLQMSLKSVRAGAEVESGVFRNFARSRIQADLPPGAAHKSSRDSPGRQSESSATSHAAGSWKEIFPSFKRLEWTACSAPLKRRRKGAG